MAASKAQVDLTEESIEECKDLMGALDMLENWNIAQEEIDGVKTLEEALILLLKELAKASSRTLWTPESAAGLMKSVLEKDRVSREELCCHFEDATSYAEELHDTAKQQLESNIPRFQSLLKTKLEQLRDDSCHILVAGETSAGKSTLLNLILGEDLLPSSLLSSTSTICELKHGKQEKIRAFKQGDPSSYDEEPLQGSKDARMETLSKFVYQKEGRDERTFEYNRVEIFLDFPLLEGGITIVDSPGVGENEKLTEMVKKYLPNAFAFMYIINSANAGGVQPDRLGDLLQALTHDRDPDQPPMFDPKSAIFVCNKWDMVPPKEAGEVWDDTIRKLKCCWPELDESQVFKISAKKAALARSQANYITKDFEKLLNGLQDLLPTGLRAKVELNYRWLTYLLDRSSFHLRVMLGNILGQEIPDLEKQRSSVNARLKKLREAASSAERKMRLYLQKRVDYAVKDLRLYLTSDEIRTWLHQWDDKELPDNDSWTVVEHLTKKLVEQGIQQAISTWDQHREFFSKLRSELMQQFRTEFNLVEMDIADIEEKMVIASQRVMPSATGHRVGNSVFYPEYSTGGLTIGQKIALGAASPLVIPIGVVVGLFALPVAGAMAIKKRATHKKQLQDYRENKTKYMEQLANGTMQDFVSDENLRRVVEQQVESTSTYLDHLVGTIPQLIESDERLMNEGYKLRKQEAITLTEEHYGPSLEKCDKIQGELNCCYMTTIRQYDIEYEDLVEREWIASGSFGDVYKAKINSTEVAMKYMTDSVSAQNATDLLHEERNLRRLCHQNVIKFHGTAYWAHHEKVVFVTELCQDNLRDYISYKKDRNPGKHRKGTAEREAAFSVIKPLAVQLATALSYIHSVNLVHRDLKLENILIKIHEPSTDGAVIKLADVGLTKKAENITGTLCGTPPYIAPEVLQEKRYGKPSDMYSFGILLWEMWYGEETPHAKHFTIPMLTEFSKEIAEGRRPDPNKEFSAPTPWKQLMTACWSTDPANRPSAEDCRTRLQEITCD
ncbi:uncharacterized protein LOC118410507 isoform X2 [Branchiostoma floridae]|uniref:Uncharacterized protein LOC118410507 isoform X2 n=1 Tax=Branchiostoma floridae TaxID=7739 RepID=A0A9J7KQ56_BRAFL|nr:uncharacterized protein LOC118410507 isoform X2 [Branchiostoma floridae]